MRCTFKFMRDNEPRSTVVAQDIGQAYEELKRLGQLSFGIRCVEYRDQHGNVLKVDPDSGLGIFICKNSVTGKTFTCIYADWDKAEAALHQQEEADRSNPKYRIRAVRAG